MKLSRRSHFFCRLAVTILELLSSFEVDGH